MLYEIVNKTPPWAFVLFFVLFGLGYRQSRARHASLGSLWLLPGAMIMLSAYGAGSAFGVSLLAAGAWIGSFWLALRYAPGRLLPHGATFDASTQRFAIAGSWVPLALMMAIYFTKYAVGVVLARQLPLAGHDAFITGVSCAYGACSGLFTARAWSIWRQRRVTQAGSPLVSLP